MRKALVVANCATKSFTSSLEALFPDWEIKGVHLNTAEKWIGEGDDRFLDYCEAADFCIGSVDNKTMESVLLDGVEKIDIPQFSYFGLHPDCFVLRGASSLLTNGRAHSKIMVGGFFAGFSEDKIRSLFNREVFSALGYLDCQAEEIKSTSNYFRKHDIEIEPLFRRWNDGTQFMHLHHHPRSQIFFDLVIEALKQKTDWFRPDDPTKIEDARADIPDYLAQMGRWPVYPGIAEVCGLESGSLTWRTAMTAGTESLDLEQAIAKTFSLLRPLNAKEVRGRKGVEEYIEIVSAL